MRPRAIALALCAIFAGSRSAHANPPQHSPSLRPAVPEVPGAHADLPFTIDGAAINADATAASIAASAGRWQWTYLDPTPAATVTDDDEAFPHRYGVADRDDRDRDGGRFIPALRYAHVAVASDRELIVSHGYHYALSGGATWLSDTWSFAFDSRRWRRLHDHIPHPALGPVARYAAVGVLVAGDLFMHGGDDGGNAERLASYKHAIYGDLWRFVLRPSEFHQHAMHSWVRVRAVVAPAPFGLASHLPAMLHPRLPRDDLYRSQHAAVLVPLGSKHELHRLDSEQERAGSRDPLAGPAPYLFASHGLATYPHSSATAGAGTGAPGAEEFDVVDGDELFVFSFRCKVWRQVRTSAPPPPRFGHALVYVPERSAAVAVAPVAAGGTTESTPADQPRGSILLYGGLSRSGVNHGDLWSLSLHSRSDADGSTRPAFVWTLLHMAYAAGSSASPGRRGYHSFIYTADHRLHLFGGARCEPGCVCSAESWLFDLEHYQARAEGWARKLSEAKRAGIALSPPRPGSADDPAACWSMLQPTSPHSPASRLYPARLARGAPEAGYNSAEESIKAGFPVHRYKQSMSLRILPMPLAAAKENAVAPAAASRSAQNDAATFSSFLFGGESYNPAAYFHDVWRFDYSHAISSSSTSEQQTASSNPRAGRLNPAALESFARLQHLLHLTPFAQFESELPSSEWIDPQPFCVHAPPGADGWGKPPKLTRPLNRELVWRSAREIAAARAQGEELDDDLNGGVAAVGFLSLASSSSLALVASLLVSLLLVVCFALCRCLQRREKVEKKG